MRNENCQKVTFAAGCFWGVEEYFSRIKGVIATQVGYTGGKSKNPDYQAVCSGETGHAEAVEITFNPNEISFDALLEHFFKIHDPTSINKQANDIGSQYRSAIFCYTPEQLEIATLEKEKCNRSGLFSRPLVTEIKMISEFFPAEDHHQKYLKKNPGGYCHIKLD